MHCITHRRNQERRIQTNIFLFWMMLFGDAQYAPGLFQIYTKVSHTLTHDGIECELYVRVTNGKMTTT